MKQSREPRPYADIDQIQALPDLPHPIRHAPDTECDGQTTAESRRVPSRVVHYLLRNARGKPWYGHLVLVALVMAAQHYEHSSIYSAVTELHSKFQLIFSYRYQGRQINDMTTFFSNLDGYMRLYLDGTVGRNSQEVRIKFFHHYQAVASAELLWLRGLPVIQHKRYQPWLLPPANRSLHDQWLDMEPIVQARQQRRKEDTDVLMQVYPDIRSEAHLRWNWFTRFRNAYRNALAQIDSSNAPAWPVEYSYVDGNWRLRMRIWRVKDLLATYSGLELPINAAVPPADTELLELVSIQEVETDRDLDVSTSLWFADLLRYAPERVRNAEATAWRKSWGYAATSFNCLNPGILFPPWQVFFNRAQACLGHVLVPVEQIFHALTFGVMAVDVFTTTGARLNELMQISLGPNCLVRLVQPAPLGAADPSPRIRYLFRLIPKGERRNVRHDFFVGTETIRLLAQVGQILAEHYRLAEKEPLPSVPFDPLHRRAHRFGVEPYLFQFGHRHLSAVSISACLRFILHGMVLRTASGRTVSLRPHLLRHGFATHAVQIQKIPVDIVGAWLHQKSVPVTKYYSQPTATMIADAADRYLVSIARTIDVEQAVLRSPAELQEQYRDAAARTGTLAEVVGGHCGAHGLCQVQFACVGCAAKVPDPTKRAQVLQRRAWAGNEIDYYRREGLLPEVRRLEQLVVAADIELREMDLIEQYRADETRHPEKEKSDVNIPASVASAHPPAAPRTHT
ncbi:hypothetical protein SAMN05444172_9315 [Burkholderia sp. GAS332]|nr:hypothetical protein SAMN05444172_9315 [Burkholderia sp. GAS332]